MKKLFYILVCLLLCAGIVGGAYVFAKTVNTNTPIAQPSEGIGNNNADSDTAEDEELNGLTVPANETSLIAKGLEMVPGAQLYMSEDSDRPMIRFTCNVSTHLKSLVEADSTKQLGMLLIPLKFFDKVNLENYTYIDWITAFDASGEDSYYLMKFDAANIGEGSSDYYMRFRLTDIPYGGINMKIACIGVLITTNSDGTKSYQYASFPNGGTYRSNARSTAYVAAQVLNAYTLGESTYTESEMTKIKGFINEAVDEANGLKSSTDDGSTFILDVSPTGVKTLIIGESFKVNASYTPSNVELPIWYRSTDESVVCVDKSGTVKALKAGTAVIGVYVAGEAFGITVKVS